MRNQNTLYPSFFQSFFVANDGGTLDIQREIQELAKNACVVSLFVDSMQLTL